MKVPSPEIIEAAETIVVREALAKGYLEEEQLREALLLREQMKETSPDVPLLRLLGARYLTRVDQQQELSQIYFRALNEVQAALSGEDPKPVPAEPPVDEFLMSSEDELAIPEFALQQSSAMLQRPPEEDPQHVQDFLARSTDEEDDDDPPADGPLEDTKGSGLWRWIRGRLSNQ